MKRLQRIAAEIEAQRPLEVFCDMDGVLTDLMGRVSELSSQEFESHGQAMRALVRLRRDTPEVFEGGRLWAGLDWTSNGRQVWQAILPYNPTILTGAVSGVGAGPGKAEWVARELGLPASKVILSRTKSEYAHPSAVLIDDTSKQINNWEEAGGIGILHSDATYQRTIQRLQEVADLLR